MTIGERLRNARERRGFTQEQLAEVVGIAASRDSEYESGRFAPQPREAAKLAAPLEVTLDELVGRGTLEGTEDVRNPKLRASVRALEETASGRYLDAASLAIDRFASLLVIEDEQPDGAADASLHPFCARSRRMRRMRPSGRHALAPGVRPRTLPRLPTRREQMKRRIILAALLASQLATTALAKNKYIPAAAKAAGANGTYWRTDVRIYNPSSSKDINVSLHFLPQGMDGRNIPGRAFHIGKRETLVLDDVVSILAPSATSAVGAIRIDSDHAHTNDDFIASSRTYTGTGDATRPGTYGQFVPALEVDDATQSAAVLHIATRPDVRANLGVMNPGLEPVTVRFTLIGVDGQPFLASLPLVVPPRSMQQWAMTDAFLFGGVYVANGAIIADATAPVFAWGSVIDNYSGDAIFVRGVAQQETDSRH